MPARAMINSNPPNPIASANRERKNTLSERVRSELMVSNASPLISFLGLPTSIHPYPKRSHPPASGTTCVFVQKYQSHGMGQSCHAVVSYGSSGFLKHRSKAMSNQVESHPGQ